MGFGVVVEAGGVRIRVDAPGVWLRDSSPAEPGGQLVVAPGVGVRLPGLVGEFGLLGMLLLGVLELGGLLGAPLAASAAIPRTRPDNVVQRYFMSFYPWVG